MAVAPGDVRLRQVALVARDLYPASAGVAAALGATDPFADPGVAEFGLWNAVFAVGDTFVEIVSPARDGTTAGRLLAKRGGDGGYMAIFQVDDAAAARRRINDLGVRVVWQMDLPDISATHLHPKDVPGAIVSLDEADPPASWRWAGPSWTGAAPPHHAGGLLGATIAVADPDGACLRWSKVLGVPAAHRVIELDRGRQRLEFVGAHDGRDGIVSVRVVVPAVPAVPAVLGGGHRRATLCGVDFVLEDVVTPHGAQRGGR